ncbi:hypothetical protein [Chelatococcus reniformis]|uniref:Uncharacterized protein n=1 Tax=Chelatococcus reniformis TaxID=1494448 RepID=A0A916U1G7_9HYPH|nr:hypothetical protein [Chelatococcus reniformis]GGC55509.1 hypothetical protein GCM10010994_12980 [Chelatococcus reniformis]
MLAPLLWSCAVLALLTAAALTGVVPFIAMGDGAVMLLAAFAGTAVVCALDGYVTE